jgi:hypothetical protein
MPPKKKWFSWSGSPLHGKNRAFFFFMTSTKEKIVAAMISCNMEVIGEGALYYSLFKTGVSADDATMAIQNLLANGLLYRSGCALILSAHAKENTYR